MLSITSKIPVFSNISQAKNNIPTIFIIHFKDELLFPNFYNWRLKFEEIISEAAELEDT